MNTGRVEEVMIRVLLALGMDKTSPVKPLSTVHYYIYASIIIVINNNNNTTSETNQNAKYKLFYAANHPPFVKHLHEHQKTSLYWVDQKVQK